MDARFIRSWPSIIVLTIVLAGLLGWATASGAPAAAPAANLTMRPSTNPDFASHVIMHCGGSKITLLQVSTSYLVEYMLGDTSGEYFQVFRGVDGLWWARAPGKILYMDDLLYARPMEYRGGNFEGAYSLVPCQYDSCNGTTKAVIPLCGDSLTIQNPPYETVGLGSNVYTVRESTSFASYVPITLTRQLLSPYGNWIGSVSFISQDGTARAGQDYEAISTTASFGWSNSTSLVMMRIFQDDAVEGSETVALTLSNPRHYKLGLASATLVIVDAPDLVLDPFQLDMGKIVVRDGKYILPVEVTVRAMLNPEPFTNVGVRLSDNGGWSSLQTIPSIAPDSSAIVQVDWDITQLLVAGQGRANVQLTVQVDPAGAIAEASEINNTQTAALGVDARPVIKDVQPQYTLGGHYFLANQSAPNTLRVLVDWNGDLAGNGAAPYGEARFNLNNVTVAEAGQNWGAAHTYDMGSDFQSSFSCANNLLRIQAVQPAAGSEFKSEETVIQPTVFSLPGWVQWAATHLPNTDANFETTLKAPLVEYLYDFKYPEPAFEATWTPPGWVPYLGGQALGILPTQGSFTAQGVSDGSGMARAQGDTGLGLAAVNIEGTIYGQGEAQFVCGQSLELQRAEMGLEIRTPVEKEAGLADVIPAVRAAEQWPVVGRIIQWVNSIAKLKATFTPRVSTVAEFAAQNDTLEFTSLKGTAGLGVKAALATEPIDGLSAEAYGGGEPYFTLQVPKNPSYLKEMGINLLYGASFKAWAFETSCETTINCRYPGACEHADAAGATYGALFAAQTAAPVWRLIPRDYAGTDYAAFAPLPCETGEGTGVGGETTLLTNIYPRPEPTLALTSTRRLLAYIHDDTAKPLGRGTEVRALIWNGSAWSSATDVTNDQSPDFNPAAAFDGNGHGLVVWERSILGAGIPPTLDVSFAQSLEIAAKTYTITNNTWSAQVISLTNNTLMDRAPQFAATREGAVLALWQTSDGYDLLGTPDHPLTLTYALWDGTHWLTPTAALSGLRDVVNVAFAAYSATQAALVYAQDADGVLSATTDLDLYYSAFDGAAWSAAARLTNDAVLDASPALAYDAQGRLHLIWLRDNNLVELQNSWNVADAQTVRAASTEAGFLGFDLTSASNGNLALVWQTQGMTSANLAYSIFDAAAGDWGAAQTLMNDAAAEAAYGPAFAADGTLYLAYQKIATTQVTATLPISGGGVYTVTNVITPSASALVFLAHTVGHDLTFDSFAAAPANPAPGQSVTLTAILRNQGDLTVVNPQVAFYDGSKAIVTQTLSTDLLAGYTTTAQLDWTVPLTTAAHILRAVADPAGVLTETDETNNATVITTTLPDLQVDVVYVDSRAEMFTVTARLANAGSMTTTQSFNVAFRTGTVLTAALSSVAITNALGIGEQFALTQVFHGPLALAALGNGVWMIADAGNTVPEMDETNNTASAPLAFLPDLAVAYAEGVITARNSGYLTATDVLVTARQDALTGTLLYSGTLAAIEPNGAASLAAIVPTGHYTLFVEADPLYTIAEMDESNNVAAQEVAIYNHIYLPLVLK